MQYTSTRGDSTSRKFMDVLKMGLAPDGGLFMPTSFPHIDLVAYKKLSYRDLAAKIIHLFAPEVNFGLVCAMCNLAYTKEAFGSDEITPLVQLDKHTSLLKLSQGPTLAFKDVAMRLVAQFMDMAQGEEQRVLNVVGATSGDTGSAAIHALMGKEFLQVFMLSPKDRMSPFQQQQMYTVDDPHIHNLVVDGPFDDCQNMVKAVFGDPGFKKLHNLGAVNSINWARIVAQVVYYVHWATCCLCSTIGQFWQCICGLCCTANGFAYPPDCCDQHQRRTRRIFPHRNISRTKG
jgi:threonine synthase